MKKSQILTLVTFRLILVTQPPEESKGKKTVTYMLFIIQQRHRTLHSAKMNRYPKEGNHIPPSQ